MREGEITREEFSVFARVLYKLWVMDPRKRVWDPCWRGVAALVFLLNGVRV